MNPPSTNLWFPIILLNDKNLFLRKKHLLKDEEEFTSVFLPFQLQKSDPVGGTRRSGTSVIEI